MSTNETQGAIKIPAAQTAAVESEAALSAPQQSAYVSASAQPTAQKQHKKQEQQERRKDLKERVHGGWNVNTPTAVTPAETPADSDTETPAEGGAKSMKQQDSLPSMYAIVKDRLFGVH